MARQSTVVSDGLDYTFLPVEREREPRWDVAQSALREIAMLPEDWDGLGTS
jgi:hypothetical protein